MDGHRLVDTTFDLRSDTPGYLNTDPDAVSPTLRRYHKLLWSKPLPNGVMFGLIDTTPGVYLHHCSQMGEFKLSSDTVIATFSKEACLPHVTKQISEELGAF